METRWKQADDETKLSVFGYLRPIEKQLILNCWNGVPLALKYYCLSYYLLHDYFTDHGNNIRLSKSGKIAQGNTKRYRPNTVYGNEIIDLNGNNHRHKWKWKFRVSQADPDSPGFWIGINNSNKAILDGAYSTNYSEEPDIFSSYALTNKGKIVGSSGSVGAIKWDKGWGKTAIIEMKLEFGVIYKKPLLSGWYLTFSVDGKTGEDVMVWIKQSKYHLAVVIGEKGQKIELLQYEFEYDK